MPAWIKIDTPNSQSHELVHQFMIFFLDLFQQFSPYSSKSLTNDLFSVMEDNLFQHYVELNIKGIDGLRIKIKNNKLNQFPHFMISLQKLSYTHMSPKYWKTYFPQEIVQEIWNRFILV